MFELCKIRTVTHEDLPMILKWRNDPNVRRFMLTQNEISPGEHANWYTKSSQDPTLRLLIVEASKAPIGYVQFKSVTAGGISHWGFYTCPNAPKGSGTKLGNVALTHAFTELKLHKVCGQVIDTNKASLVFHQRLGFKQEGFLRDHHCIDGVYHSLICFGLLAHEWQPLSNATEPTYAQH